MSSQRKTEQNDKQKTKELYRDYQKFLIELDKLKKEAQKICAIYAERISNIKNKKGKNISYK